MITQHEIENILRRTIAMQHRVICDDCTAYASKKSAIIWPTDE